MLVIAGAWAVATVRGGKVCVALGVTPLAAVIVSVVEPAGVAVVLARVAVPLPLSTNVTPGAGESRSRVSAGVGVPVVLTAKLPAVPVEKVVLVLVMAGAWLTVRVKVWVALGVTPLAAVKCREYVPPVPAAGVPLSTPVAALNVTPPGKVPVSLRLGSACRLRHQTRPTGRS